MSEEQKPDFHLSGDLAQIAVDQMALPFLAVLIERTGGTFEFRKDDDADLAKYDFEVDLYGKERFVITVKRKAA